MELAFALFLLAVIAWALVPDFPRRAWAHLSRRRSQSPRAGTGRYLDEIDMGWPPPEGVDWPPDPRIGERR